MPTTDCSSGNSKWVAKLHAPLYMRDIRPFEFRKVLWLLFSPNESRVTLAGRIGESGPKANNQVFTGLREVGNQTSCTVYMRDIRPFEFRKLRWLLFSPDESRVTLLGRITESGPKANNRVFIRFQ